MFSGVHEAAHVYRADGLAGETRYHMIYERNLGTSAAGERLFGLAAAPSLSGPWRSVTEAFARGDQLAYLQGAVVWTRDISHGEALRTGHDERLAYDAASPRRHSPGTARSLPGDR